MEGNCIPRVLTDLDRQGGTKENRNANNCKRTPHDGVRIKQDDCRA